MKLIIIFGPQAVGKMTVGHELEKTTDLKLFHNHMTIEIIAPLFGYGSKSPVGTKLVNLFRQKIFEEFTKSDQEGLIFTYLWAFNKQDDWDYIDNVCNIFESQGGIVYLVELEAAVDERLERNKHPHRLSHKPTKRNLERSEKDLKDSMKKYRMNSKSGEIKRENYIRIDNTNLSPEETAQKIKEKFQL
jgi:DNA integrity scanning protein DisA with diadenylate cyclase activity